MDEAFDAVDIYEYTKVYHASDDALDGVTNFEFCKTLSEAVFDSFLLGEDKLVFFLNSIENANLDRLANERVEALKNLVFV